MDLEELGKIAGAECKRQGCEHPRDLAQLIQAWVYAGGSRSFLDLAETMMIASIIEPTNLHKFRQTPVTFQNGGTSAPWQEIPRLMINLFQNKEQMTVEEFVREFLWIHPFRDGNGRTGWILYNWRNNSWDNPVALPDFKFGESVG